jgi:hypothetical protein
MKWPDILVSMISVSTSMCLIVVYLVGGVEYYSNICFLKYFFKYINIIFFIFKIYF